ncbi:helicase associated domain-containing protein [Streptacidiphilus sp. PAMC 29251]
MSGKYRLRRHQVEAITPLVHELSVGAGGEIPPGGLRTQFLSPCGSGKTFASTNVARKVVRAGRLLNWSPSLDLLSQTVSVWIDAGFPPDKMVAVCSLSPADVSGVRCTTSPPRLALWLQEMGQEAIVFSTYASLAVLIEIHEGTACLPPVIPWNLMIMDEAHRTSGFIGKAWAAVHSDQLIPSERRLYMTATARIWDDSAAVKPRPGRYVPLTRKLSASMDDVILFGNIGHKLSLADAIERELLANYEIVCLEIRDQVLYEQLSKPLSDDEEERDEVREARLAAMQVALLRAMAERGIERVLTFHHRTKEAERFAETLSARAAEWAADDPTSAPGDVWADWLYGEHEPSYRRAVLQEFAELPPGASAVLSNVRVLAEGVDLSADAVLFADPRSSVVDTVQIMGRALRQQRPGMGKIASLLVPIFLPAKAADDEDLLSSRAWDPLVKILQALRSHDEDAVEQLAIPQQNSRGAHILAPSGLVDEDDALVVDAALMAAATVAEELGGHQVPAKVTELAPDMPGVTPPPTKPARGPQLRFADDRFSAADVALMVSLRVIVPEHQSWLRGLAALRRWKAQHGHVLVPVTAMDDSGRWPLGRFVADQRVEYWAGRLDPLRAQLLADLGMVWSVNDHSWVQGVAFAKKWAEIHGNLCAPVSAVLENYALGRWLATARAQALLPLTDLGSMPQSRRDELAAIDPFWCPAWGVVWQRMYGVLVQHLAAGGTLAVEDGRLIEGEDLGRWLRRQAELWGELDPEQVALLEGVGLQAPPVVKTRPVRVSNAQRYARGVAAARLFFEREGHLRVPRAHEETLEDGTVVRLGDWRKNVRSNRAGLTVEQVRELEAVGMDWPVPKGS